MKTLVIIGIMSCVMLFGGCGPETAEIIADPNFVAIETAAEGAVGLTQALGALWPALIPVGTAAGGLLAMYKRLKPKIVEANESTDKCLAAGSTLTTILEDIKNNEPVLWEKIGPKIKEASKAAADIESTITDFRQLGA